MKIVAYRAQKMMVYNTQEIESVPRQGKKAPQFQTKCLAAASWVWVDTDCKSMVLDDRELE